MKHVKRASLASLASLVLVGCVVVDAMAANPTILTVDTVATMKAIPASALATNQEINVLGYTSVGDGGGGIFHYYSGSATTTNLCTVFAPTVGSGRLKRQMTTVLIPEQCGAKGDGVANDATPLQAAMQVSAASGYTLFANGTYYIGSTSLASAITSNLSMDGSGIISGTPVASTNCAADPASCFATSLFGGTGTLATGLSLGSGNIAIGTNSFTVNNTYAPGDAVLISNTASLATSRAEILYVSTASATGFTTVGGTIEHYAGSTGAIVQKITPVKNFSIKNITLKNIFFQCIYCASFSVRGVTGLSSETQFNFSYGWDLNFKYFDAELTLNGVDPVNANMDFSISGFFTNGKGVSDNGLVKTNGAHNYNIDIVCDGSVDDGGSRHCFEADNYYAENPYGFLYLDNQNATVRVTEKNISGNAVSITASDPGTSDSSVKDFHLSGSWPNGFNCNGASGMTITADFAGSAGFDLNNCSGISFSQYNGSSTPTLTGTNTLIRGVQLPWTPGLAGASTAGTFTPGGANTGSYVLNGSVVTLTCGLTGTLSGATGSSVLLTGLPITPAGSGNIVGSINFSQWSGTLDSSYTTLGAYVSGGGASATLTESGSGQTTQVVSVAQYTTGSPTYNNICSGSYTLQ